MYAPSGVAGIANGVVNVLHTMAAIAAGEATQAATAMSAALVQVDETNAFFMVMSTDLGNRKATNRVVVYRYSPAESQNNPDANEPNIGRCATHCQTFKQPEFVDSIASLP